VRNCYKTTHGSGDEKLDQKITLMAGQMNVGSHSLLTLIAEFDVRKGWGGDGTVRSCAHWLNWQCGIALGAAREKVRVARCLQQLQDQQKSVPAETFSKVVDAIEGEEPSRFQDLKGRVLNIGRRTRTVPAYINRALNIRDKTCRVPGCCES
jgi:hypothetical protein